MKTRTSIQVLALAAVVAVAGASWAGVQAQEPVPVPDNPASASMGRMLGEQLFIRALRPPGASPASPGRSRPGAKRTSGTTSFVAEDGRLMPARLAEEVGRTSDEKATLVRLFDQCLTSYEEAIRSLKAPEHDIGTAMAAMITTNYQIATRQEVPDPQVLVLVSQLRGGLLADARFQAMSNRDRQETYEAIAINSTFDDLVYRRAQQSGDLQRQAQLAQEARKKLELLLQVRFERLHLGSKGLEIQG